MCKEQQQLRKLNKKPLAKLSTKFRFQVSTMLIHFVFIAFISTLLKMSGIPKRDHKTVNYFFGVLSHLFVEEFKMAETNSLEVHLQQSLALLERDFPTVLSNITTNICHHFCAKKKKISPAYSSWMFFFQQINSWISRRFNKASDMERCVMETYQVNFTF